MRIFYALAVAAVVAFGAATGNASMINTLINGMCLDLTGGIGAPNGTQFIIWPCHGGANQQFAFPGDGTIRLPDGRCVDAASGRGNPGDAVIAWPCHGGANQKWSYVGNGFFQGINNLCVDVRGGGSAQGTPVIVWQCHGGTNQRWSMK